LEDFIYELYARAHRARGGNGAELHQLIPYLSAEVRGALAHRGAARGAVAVDGIIIGGMDVSPPQRDRANNALISVSFETNYTEVGASGQRQGYYAREVWTFERALTARTPPPDRVRALNCPACGAPVSVTEQQSCAHCGTAYGAGNVDWYCRSVRLMEEAVRAPALTSYTPEAGGYTMTITSPQLDAQIHGLRQSDPQFDVNQFLARVGHVYQMLNVAWSSLQWERVRAFTSDRFWTSMLYWIEAYRAQRLCNRMDDAVVERVTPVKLERDKHYDALTVRIFARARDYTIHMDSNQVACGNPNHARRYSEYWTFIRSSTTRGPARTDPACPNCGAPLQVNMAGNCEHCSSKLTSGEFDWVLSRIEQDESYRG
jgi:predicted lipid-binding transport protein (Tim44 family)